jgi:uncharacterized membrane protein
MAITSLHGAAATVLSNILSAIIATYLLCKLGILPGVLFTVCVTDNDVAAARFIEGDSEVKVIVGGYSMGHL